MKITKFVPDFATYANVWPSSFISSGSNSLAVAEITANGTDVPMLPIVNLSAGSNITLSVSSNSISINAATGAVSYASNSNDVSLTSAAGASTLVSRADHVHKGVRTFAANGSNQSAGDVNLVAGTNIAISAVGSNFTITNIGSGGGGGGSVSFGSNSNDVSGAGAAGASTLASRADHVHRGVHLLTSNTSNSLYGDVNLSAGSGITLSVSGQSITVAASGAAGGGGTTGARYPVQFAVAGSASSTSRAPVLGATPTNGNYLILVALAESTDAVSTVVTTNATWAKIAQTTAGVAPVIEIWGASVGASVSATTTVTWAASAFHNAIVMEWSGLAGTLDTSATRHVTNDPTGTHYIPIVTPSVVTALVIAATSTISNGNQFSSFSGTFLTQLTSATVGVQWGFPGLNGVYGTASGGSSGTSSGITLSLT